MIAACLTPITTDTVADIAGTAAGALAGLVEEIVLQPHDRAAKLTTTKERIDIRFTSTFSRRLSVVNLRLYGKVSRRCLACDDIGVLACREAERLVLGRIVSTTCERDSVGLRHQCDVTGGKHDQLA